MRLWGKGMVLMLSERSIPVSRRLALEEEKGSLYRRMVELERRGMRFEREAGSLREVERHYWGLMDSEVFLFLIVALNGHVLACNRCVEKFWGVDLRGVVPTSLQSLCAPESARGLKELLLRASQRKLRSRLLLDRPNDVRVSIEAELAPVIFQGGDAIQVIGVDVTERLLRKPVLKGEEPWREVLDSCPGLLCCVLDEGGRLLYASRGYRAVAKRFLGHDCVLGSPYPPEATVVDRSLHDLLSSAFLGGTNGMQLVEPHEEGNRPWDVTASPLWSSQEKVVGAVLHMMPVSGLAVAPRSPSPEVTDVPKSFSLDPVLLDAVSDMLVVVDREGVCLTANKLFFESLSIDSDGFVGRSLKEMLWADDPLDVDFPSRLCELLRVGEGALELRVGTNRGELLWLDLRGHSVKWEGVDAVLLTCRDVTLLRRTQEQLRRVSVMDRTTGLLNRQGMEQVLVKELERAARYRGSLCLLFMDIDDFRRLNETRGYAASDRAMKTLMTALKNILRPTDFLGRWGGDEFMVLTPQSDSAACQLADVLRDTARNGICDREESISLSIGVAKFSKEMDVSSFVGAAYDAMVEAKKSGGDRTVLANGERLRNKI